MGLPDLITLVIGVVARVYRNQKEEELSRCQSNNENDEIWHVLWKSNMLLCPVPLLILNRMLVKQEKMNYLTQYSSAFFKENEIYCLWMKFLSKWCR